MLHFPPASYCIFRHVQNVKFKCIKAFSRAKSENNITYTYIHVFRKISSQSVNIVQFFKIIQNERESSRRIINPKRISLNLFGLFLSKTVYLSIYTICLAWPVCGVFFPAQIWQKSLDNFCILALSSLNIYLKFNQRN